MDTYQERLDQIAEWHESRLAELRRELLALPILEYWTNKWSPLSEDPKDESLRYSCNDWTSARFYLDEEDTTKCINLFIEMMNSDPRIDKIFDAEENEKHVAYRVTTNIRGPYSWVNQQFSIYFYFDRSKFCHAEISKIEVEHQKYEHKTFKVMCA